MSVLTFHDTVELFLILANGVMTYHPSSQDGSWEETCTLPACDKDVCAAVLNTFVSWYGQR